MITEPSLDPQQMITEPSLDPAIGDQEVRQYLLDHFQISNSLEVQTLDKEERNIIILSLLDLGAGLRQLSRLTGVTYGVINKLNKRR